MFSEKEMHNLVNLAARLNSIIEIVKDEEETTEKISNDFQRTLKELKKTWENLR